MSSSSSTSESAGTGLPTSAMSAGTALLTSGAATTATDAVKQEAWTVRSWLYEGPLALKAVCFCGCAAAFVVGIFEILGNLLNPLAIIVSGYACLFAFIGMVLEVKPLCCTRWCKTRIEFWVKILGRVWGRGVFYLLVAGMQFAQGSLPAYIVGGVLVGCSIFSCIVARAAGAKLNSLHDSLINKFGEKDITKVRQAFLELDHDNSGALDTTELALVATSLGAELSSDELTSVFELLDLNNDGKVEFEEFRSWWLGEKEVDYSCV